MQNVISKIEQYTATKIELTVLKNRADVAFVAHVGTNTKGT